jgi:hypothetical protein
MDGSSRQKVGPGAASPGLRSAGSEATAVGCPAGRGVLGAGVDIDNTGELAVTGLRLGSYAGSHFVTVDVAENPSTFGGTFWNIRGYAICATL